MYIKQRPIKYFFTYIPRSIERGIYLYCFFIFSSIYLKNCIVIVRRTKYKKNAHLSGTSGVPLSFLSVASATLSNAVLALSKVSSVILPDI
nr:MAG TPA: hypothetical protein [Caudoviricetes sp.]